MPSYEQAEAAEQAVKAARYFGRVLDRAQDSKFIAVNVGGVTLVVAVGSTGKKLEEALAGGLFGQAAFVNRATGNRAVVLIPRYHEPPPEHASKPGHVHLHVLETVKLGRRERKSGECLCTKKHGSKERAPQPGETEMCAECVRVAEEFKIEWSLD